MFGTASEPVIDATLLPDVSLLTEKTKPKHFLNPYTMFRKPFKLFMDNVEMAPHQKLLELLIPKIQKIHDTAKAKGDTKVDFDAFESDPNKEKLEYLLDGLDRFHVEFKSIIGTKLFLKEEVERETFKKTQRLYRKLLGALSVIKPSTPVAGDNANTTIPDTDLAPIASAIAEAKKELTAKSMIGTKRVPTPAPTSFLVSLQLDGHVVFEKRADEKYLFFVSDGKMDRLKRIIRKMEKRFREGDTSRKIAAVQPRNIYSKGKIVKVNTENLNKKDFDAHIKGMNIDELVEEMRSENSGKNLAFSELQKPKNLTDHQTALEEALKITTLAKNNKAALQGALDAVKRLIAMKTNAESIGHYVMMKEGMEIVSDSSMRNFVEAVGFKNPSGSAPAASKTDAPTPRAALIQYGKLPARKAVQSAMTVCSFLKGERACDKWDLTSKRLKSCPLSKVSACPDEGDNGTRLNAFLNKILEKLAPEIKFTAQHRENLFWFMVLAESVLRENPVDNPSKTSSAEEEKE